MRNQIYSENDEQTPLLTPVSTARVFTQLTSSVIASLGSFYAGTVLGWSSPAHANIKGSSSSLGTVTANDLLWLSILCMTGLLLGSLAVGYNVKKYGRRISLLLLCIPSFIGWLLMALANNVWLLASGRLITGFCGGAFCVIAPLYISEIAHDSIRGRLTVLGNTMLSLGIVYSYTIGSLLSWEWMSAACGIIPVLLFLGAWLYLRETPIHLIEKRKIGEAYKVLYWLHESTAAEGFIEARFREISLTVDTDLETGSLTNLFQPQSWKPVLICLALFACQQLCGVNAIVFYSTEIFSLAGTNLGPNLAAILVASTQALFVALSSTVIDRVGRKVLMIISEAGMAVACLVMGFYFFSIEQNDNIPPLGLGWIPEISLIMYMIMYSIGASPLPWLMMAELCPNNLRGLSSSIVSAFCWLLALIVVGTFDPLVNYVGASGVFWIYSCTSAFGFLFSITCLPETSGKSLFQINLCFKDQ